MNERRLARHTLSARVSEHAFLGVSSLLFAVCVATTIEWCASASTMGSSGMMWTRMPGQSWLDAAASFVAMWAVMMVAMMLPSLMTALRRRRAFGWSAVRAGIGYFWVWT
ncbi:MAG: DUF2182 domain-containing protein, partial [Gemmatimonadaceae bacterium]